MVIDEYGITKSFSGEYVTWDMIGGYKDKVRYAIGPLRDVHSKGDRYGIGIINKDDTNPKNISSNYYECNYIMFIRDDIIAANKNEIIDVIKKGHCS